MMKKNIEKRFPADTRMEKEGQKIKTFLNDSKVDAELYAYLLSISRPVDGETRVYKTAIPTIDKLRKEILNCKSRQTVYNHLNYLISNEYITDTEEYYIINMKKEEMYFPMPLELIKYFIDVLKQPVIKTYIYLAQRYSYKKNYSFTIKELCEHLGLCYKVDRNREAIKNYLDCLQRLGLINFEKFYENQVPRMRLIEVKNNIEQ